MTTKARKKTRTLSPLTLTMTGSDFAAGGRTTRLAAMAAEERMEEVAKGFRRFGLLGPGIRRPYRGIVGRHGWRQPPSLWRCSHPLAKTTSMGGDTDRPERESSDGRGGLTFVRWCGSFQ